MLTMCSYTVKNLATIPNIYKCVLVTKKNLNHCKTNHCYMSIYMIHVLFRIIFIYI